MAITASWKQCGGVIQKEPRLTLGAFLGHRASMEAAKAKGVRYPRATDFETDPAYDPDPYQLGFSKESVRCKFLLLCTATWGAEVLVRIVNACSLLQCMHHRPAGMEHRRLRDEVAFALQTMIDMPSDDARKKADALLQRCQATYRPHEEKPDSGAAGTVWYDLGAPWFGLEACLSERGALADCGESEPAPANSSWIARQTTWPDRAIDAAAHWSSHSLVEQVIRSTLIAWAIRS